MKCSGMEKKSILLYQERGKLCHFLAPHVSNICPSNIYSQFCNLLSMQINSFPFLLPHFVWLRERDFPGNLMSFSKVYKGAYCSFCRLPYIFEVFHRSLSSKLPLCCSTFLPRKRTWMNNGASQFLQETRSYQIHSLQTFILRLDSIPLGEKFT